MHVKDVYLKLFILAAWRQSTATASAMIAIKDAVSKGY